VNPIGCGDSVAGGVAYGLWRQADPVECVRWGLAAAAANLEQLAAGRFSTDRVDAWRSRVRIDLAVDAGSEPDSAAENA
jgi:sugar/nucleoside kinase (ribokinase family)